MKSLFAHLAIFGAVFASPSVFAQAPAGAPAGSTGLCKDGSYTSNDAKKGACAGHKGVKDWFGTAMAMAPAAAKAPMPASAPAMTSKPASAASKGAAAVAAAAPAAGGGPGQVWVNSSSKVYHCAGTKYYGKTKQGAYMTEAAAKAAGNHADHAKACS